VQRKEEGEKRKERRKEEGQCKLTEELSFSLSFFPLSAVTHAIALSALETHTSYITRCLINAPHQYYLLIYI
jgi:hypothetical protein